MDAGADDHGADGDGASTAPASPEGTGAERTGAAARWARILSLLLVVAFALSAGLRLVGHDAALLLAVGEAMADGQVAYRDVLELSFPGSLHLSAMAARLGRLTGLGGPAALCLLLLAWLLALARLAVPALTAAGLPLPSRRLVGIGFLGVAWLHPSGWELAQREHFVGPALVAFALVAAVPPPIRGESWVGFAAGAMLWLKPQAGVVPVATLAAALLLGVPWRRRLVLGLFLGGAAGFLLFLQGVDLEGFRRWSLEEGMLRYQAFRNPMGEVVVAGLVRQQGWVFLTVLGLASVLGLSPTEGSGRRPVLCLVAAGLAAIGLFLGQGKGWEYHLLPFRLLAAAALLVALGFRLETVAPAAGDRRLPDRLSVVLALGLLVGLGAQLPSQIEERAFAEAVAARVAALAPEGEPVTVLTWGVSPPPFYTTFLGRPQGTRFLWLGWWIPLYRLPGGAFHRTLPPESLARAPEREAMLGGLLLADLVRSRPAVLVLQSGPPDFPMPFTVEGYFSGVEEFRSWLGANYRKVDPRAPVGARAVYLRRDLGPPPDSPAQPPESLG